MKIDDQLIQKLEKLSMIHLKETEKNTIKKDLNEIIEFVENLNEIDVDNIEASFSTVNTGTPMREDDTYCNKDIVNKIKQNAPHMESNFFIVPQII
jgi:aspartyl-tRNA(Asn)/glutamyl-tRNA(Gln) amidotransferase subunit C